MAQLEITSPDARTQAKRVAVVERRQPGGECLNDGCIPSKALISPFKARHERVMVVAVDDEHIDEAIAEPLRHTHTAEPGADEDDSLPSRLTHPTQWLRRFPFGHRHYGLPR